MDLSDISEFKDLMTTSSDEDIPVLEDSIHWKTFWFELNIYTYRHYFYNSFKLHMHDQ